MNCWNVFYLTMLNERTINCPYCGEAINLLIDTSAGTQHYIEDCAVCCRPIEIGFQVDNEGNASNLVAGRDDE